MILEQVDSSYQSLIDRLCVSRAAGVYSNSNGKCRFSRDTCSSGKKEASQ